MTESMLMWIFNFVVKPLGFVNDQQKGGKCYLPFEFHGNVKQQSSNCKQRHLS